MLYVKEQVMFLLSIRLLFANISNQEAFVLAELAVNLLMVLKSSLINIRWFYADISKLMDIAFWGKSVSLLMVVKSLDQTHSQKKGFSL